MTTLSENLSRAEGFLARFRETGVQNHIGGKSCPAVSSSGIG